MLDQQIDRANRAVRDYQAGKCTTAFVQDALSKIRVGDLVKVSIATRLPVSQLEKLRGEH